MLTVELRPELAEQLNKEAKRRQTNVEELVNQWLQQALWEERNKKIHEESKRFHVDFPVPENRIVLEVAKSIGF